MDGKMDRLVYHEGNRFLIRCDFEGLLGLVRRAGLTLCHVEEVHTTKEKWVKTPVTELRRAYAALLDLDGRRGGEPVRYLWRSYYVCSAAGKRNDARLAGVVALKHTRRRSNVMDWAFDILLDWGDKPLPAAALRLIECASKEG